MRLIMKSIYIKISTLACALILLSTTGVEAQVKSTYFLDNSFQRMELNPALQPSRGYISLGLANISPDVSTGPFSLDRIFEMKSGEYLDASKFSSYLNAKNPVSNSIQIQPFGLGFYTRKIFWNLSVSLKEQSTVSLPKSLFDIVSNSNGSYSLKSLYSEAMGYVETGLGASFPLNKKLTIGGKVKYLMGIGYLQGKFNKLDVNLNDNTWGVDMDAQIRASVNNGPQMAAGEFKLQDYTDKIKAKDLAKGFNNRGTAIDLGATYKLLDNLTLSLAMTDLGSISWKKSNNLEAVVNNYKATFFDLNKTVNSLQNDLKNLPEVKLNSVTPSDFKTSLHSKINAGAEYSVLKNKISFGALYSKQSGINPISSITLSTNLKPMKVFNAALTYTTGSYNANAFGAAISWTPKWFMNFFLATDYIVARYNPEMIPVNAKRANVQFGISIPLKSRRSDVLKAAILPPAPHPFAQKKDSVGAVADTLMKSVNDSLKHTILPDSIPPLKMDTLKKDSVMPDSIPPIKKDSTLKSDSIPVLKTDSIQMTDEAQQINPADAPLNQNQTPSSPQQKKPQPIAFKKDE